MGLSKAVFILSCSCRKTVAGVTVIVKGASLIWLQPGMRRLEQMEIDLCHPLSCVSMHCHIYLHWWFLNWFHIDGKPLGIHKNLKACTYYNPEIPVILRKNHRWSLQWSLEEQPWLLLNTQLSRIMKKSRTVVHVCKVLIFARHCVKCFTYFYYSQNPLRDIPII